MQGSDYCLLQPHQRFLLGMMIQPQEIFKALLFGEALFCYLHVAVERGGGFGVELGCAKARVTQKK